MTHHPDSHPVYRLSGLGRPVDPSVPTNRWAATLALVAFLFGAGWALYGSAALGEVVWSGANAALTVFLAWALTRELLPDDDAAAFVAVGLAAAGWVVWGKQALLPPAAIMLSVRVVNRSTGKAAEPWDTAFVAVGFGALAWLGSWVYGVVAGVALILDAVLAWPGGQDSRLIHLPVGLVLLAVALVRLLRGSVAVVEVPWPFLLLAGVGVGVGVLHPIPHSVGDVDEKPLERARVQAGLVLGAASVILAALAGTAPVVALWVGWASVAATVVGMPRRWI